MNRILTTAALCALTLGAADYKIVARYPVPGNGGFDYITYDPAAGRIYLSHGTQVDVIEAEGGKLAGTIADTPGVHGIAIATPFKHGFTSNGGENKVSMFDLATLALIKKIDVGGGPDGIYYHAASKRVFTNNHRTHDITAINASTGAVLGTVKVEGDGEQAVVGPKGLIYVNSEDTAEVVVFDPRKLTVVKRFPIASAKTPTGLAYDAKNNRLFIACRKEPKMIVMDAASGKEIANLPIGAGADWAEFDRESKLVFVSTGEGILNVFHQNSSDEYEAVGAIKTQPGAKTMAFDPKSKKIFLPSVEYEVAPAAEAGKQPRRTVKPGTFAVIVLAK